MMPLAHICCNSNKSRVQIGFLTRNEYEPGKLAHPVSWLKPSMFDHDGERMAQADQLESLDVASVYIRLESGHSNPSTVQPAKFVPGRFEDRYLIHGRNEKNSPIDTPPRLTSGRNSWRKTRCPFCTWQLTYHHAGQSLARVRLYHCWISILCWRLRTRIYGESICSDQKACTFQPISWRVVFDWLLLDSEASSRRVWVDDRLYVWERRHASHGTSSIVRAEA